MDFVVRKNIFCFFSKRTFSESAVCLAETDKVPKMTHPGFVFYCLVLWIHIDLNSVLTKLDKYFLLKSDSVGESDISERNVEGNSA